MDTGRVLGILGAAILIIGVFSPILSGPIVGSITYFNNGRGDGVAVLIIGVAVAGILVGAVRYREWTIVLGAAAVGLVSGAFARATYALNALRSEMTRELAGNPFAGFADAMVGGIQMQWGWALLLIGGLLVLLGPLVGRSPQIARRTLAIAAVTGVALFSAIAVLPFRAGALNDQAADPISVEKDNEAQRRSESPARSPSRWEVSESVSEMDGSRRVVASLQSVDSVAATWGHNRPSLIIRCAGNETNLYVATQTVVRSIYGEFDRSRVRWRIDDSGPRTEVWNESTDSQAVFAPQPIRFARQLVRGKSFVFEFTPYDSAPVTARFDLSEMESAVSRVADACGWRVEQ